jgi:cell wall-associated NlpC family hydrolase
MSSTLLGSTMPRRFAAMLIAAMFGLTLAVNPATATKAEAAVTAGQGVRAVQIAALQVGVPYVWGGTTRRGFDCSGLTQYVFKRLGHRIPRVAQAQYNASIKLRPRMQRKGDLVFFFSGRSVYHVGIYAGNGWMYAAPRAGQRVKKQRVWSSAVRYGRVR